MIRTKCMQLNKLCTKTAISFDNTATATMCDQRTRRSPAMLHAVQRIRQLSFASTDAFNTNWRMA
jgi:hypothetical protein